MYTISSTMATVQAKAEHKASVASTILIEHTIVTSRRSQNTKLYFRYETLPDYALCSVHRLQR